VGFAGRDRMLASHPAGLRLRTGCSQYATVARLAQLRDAPVRDPIMYARIEYRKSAVSAAGRSVAGVRSCAVGSLDATERHAAAVTRSRDPVPPAWEGRMGSTAAMTRCVIMKDATIHRHADDNAHRPAPACRCLKPIASPCSVSDPARRSRWSLSTRRLCACDVPHAGNGIAAAHEISATQPV
jgi:hypothetical protein